MTRLPLDPMPTARELRAIAEQRGVLPPSGPLAPRSGGEAGDVLFFAIPGAPRTKKNHGKIWKVGNRKVVMPSDPWLRWRDAALVWFKQRPASFRRAMSGHAGLMNCEAIFYRDAERGDATGYYQGLADVLEELGIVVNDQQLVQWDGSRLLVDRENPRTVITLTPVEAA